MPNLKPNNKLRRLLALLLNPSAPLNLKLGIEFSDRSNQLLVVNSQTEE